MRCQHCDGDLKEAFRFCPWCAAPQRIKLVEHFSPHPLIEEEPAGLRVSRYLVDTRHVRLSIWNDDRAVAAISLDEDEAARLSRFLSSTDGARGRLDRLRTRVGEVAAELDSVIRGR